MSRNTYIDALRRAKADLIQAIMKRDMLNLEIVRLQQLVKRLTYQATKLETPGDLDTESTGETIGFTDAVFTILRTSHDALTARNIRDRLVELGYELGKYSNPLGFIHSVLGRLESQGKIRQSQPGVYVVSSPFYQALYMTGLSDSSTPTSSLGDVVPGGSSAEAKDRALARASTTIAATSSQRGLVPGELPKPENVKSPKK